MEKSLVTFSKAIGVIGGAGPSASALLYKDLVVICQKKYRSKDYNEFPEIIIVSYPFTRGNEDEIRKEISFCLSKLKGAGSSLFCIASNSFHAYLPEHLEEGFINLIDEGLREAKRLGVSKALILGAQTTINLKLYERSSIKCIYPPKAIQHRITQIIGEIAGGMVEEDQAIELKNMISLLISHVSFDGVIIACTELPLIHRKISLSDAPFQVIDTVEVLANCLIDRATSML